MNAHAKPIGSLTLLMLAAVSWGATVLIYEVLIVTRLETAGLIAPTHSLPSMGETVGIAAVALLVALLVAGLGLLMRGDNPDGGEA